MMISLQHQSKKYQQEINVGNFSLKKMMCFLAINIKQKEGVEKKFQTALADLSGDLWREINFFAHLQK